jgi:hypothetical protein
MVTEWPMHRHLVQDTGHDASAEALKAVVDILNLLILDVANISHKVGVVASAVRNLLVDVVVSKNLVDLSEHTGDVSVNENDLAPKLACIIDLLSN